jgi:hypothetical protein
MATPHHALVPAAPQAATLEDLARLLAAASHDAACHHRLLADPKAELTRAGFILAEGVQVTAEITAPAEADAVAARSTADHLVLPVPPLAGTDSLNDADLEGVAGGVGLFGSLLSTLMPVMGSVVGKLFGSR